MLDRKFIVENAELVQAELRQPRRRRSTSIASSSSKTPRKAKQTEVEELNRQANEVSKSIGQAKDAGRARGPQGRRPPAARADRRAARPSSTRLDAELDAHPPARSPTCRIPTPRSACDDKANLRTVPRQDAAAAVRLQAAGSRRAGREARPDRLRGRRPRGRPRLLLPQERGRAAGAGPAAATPCDVLMAEGFTPDDHARPGPKRRPRRASASFPAGRRRRSTASRTPT